MRLIGLGGSIGTGKSTVASIFEEYGCCIIDADKISKEIVFPQTEVWKAIVKYFGNEVLLPDKNINRKKLAALAFADKKKLYFLNSLTHPTIKKTMQLRLENIKDKKPDATIICDIPLLFETDIYKKMQKNIALWTETEIQIQRVLTDNKRNITYSEVMLRIQTQMETEKRNSLADFVIDNNQDINFLKQQAEEIFQNIQQLPEISSAVSFL